MKLCIQDTILPLMCGGGGQWSSVPGLEYYSAIVGLGNEGAIGARLLGIF